MASRNRNKDIQEIDVTPFEHDKLDHDLTMLITAIGDQSDKDRIDKIIEDFIFDFDTCFRHQEQVMTQAEYRLLVSHSNDHSRIMDLLSSLRYANMVEIMPWDEIRRVIENAYHRHAELFDDVFADYIRLRKALAGQLT